MCVPSAFVSFSGQQVRGKRFLAVGFSLTQMILSLDQLTKG
jgi:hypothetical protein